MSAGQGEVKPYRRAGNHRTPNQRRAEALEVLRLKRLGWLDVQIAKEVGISLSMITKRLQQALAEHGEPTAAAYREVTAQQYDMLLQACMAGVEARDPEFIGKATQILRDKARLLGIEAPVRAEVEVTEVTPQERALRDLIAQAERDAKLREASIVDGEVVES